MEAIFIPKPASLSHFKTKFSSNPKHFFKQQPFLPIRQNPSRFRLVTAALQNQQQAASKDTKEESYGEVKGNIDSRALDAVAGMKYLIEWKDGHKPSWVPTDFIAKDVIVEYETLWWTPTKKVDKPTLRNLIESSDDCDVDAVDVEGRTTLLFVAGLGSEPCVKLLVEASAKLTTPTIVAVSLRYTWRRGISDARLGLEGVVRFLEGAVFEYAKFEWVKNLPPRCARSLEPPRRRWHASTPFPGGHRGMRASGHRSQPLEESDKTLREECKSHIARASQSRVSSRWFLSGLNSEFPVTCG
ncbi:Signal recognition particle protein [Vigna angularis]|uniref:Signal recognition particle protein n=1 Tax=Phaseolus angularis TaxID=3914 RepID=A0A8T0JR15_PHAAN|nr:Signal recognition particle protein [Vigna angularis]